MTTGLALVFALSLQAAPASTTAVVTGQILTPDGSPAAAIRVSAIPAPPPDARPQDGSQYYEAQPAVASALTNGQGRYRLANVPPGRYHIVVGVLGQATYYPDTLDMAQATVVTLAAGATRQGTDIRLATPYGGGVRGRVTPPPGSGDGEIAVLSGLRLEELLEAPVAADGTFEFGHVPRGAYLLSMFPQPPGTASIAFQVGDEDVASLEVRRLPMQTITGRIVVRGAPFPRPILAFATDTSHVTAAVRPDGTFAVRLQAARHRIDFGGLPVGYAITSARVGDTDVSSGLVVADRDIDGLVVTVTGPTDAGATP